MRRLIVGLLYQVGLELQRCGCLRGGRKVLQWSLALDSRHQVWCRGYLGFGAIALIALGSQLYAGHEERQAANNNTSLIRQVEAYSKTSPTPPPPPAPDPHMGQQVTQRTGHGRPPAVMRAVIDSARER